MHGSHSWVRLRLPSMVFCGVAAGWLFGEAIKAAPLFAEDHLIIKFKAEARAKVAQMAPAAALAALAGELGLPAGAQSREPHLPRLLREKRPGGGDALDLSYFFYLHLPAGLTAEEGVRRWARHPLVEYVERDGTGTGGLLPNDPNFPNQWHHRNLAKPSAAIRTPEAWDITQGSTNVLVAVIPQIDLVAPGTNIYTVQTNGTLGRWWGTSFSTPLVAGVSALLVGLRPELTPEQIRTLLCAGADDQVGATGDTPGFDYYYGWGRLNAWNSILLARTRIDTVQVTKAKLVLSWLSPTNAVTRQPYQVAGATALGGPWTPLTNTGNFGYLSGRTYWTNAIAASNGPVNFYKVGLRTLVP